MFSASSPTGPAFEGAQIVHGIRAAPGAIERVRDGGTRLSRPLSPRFQETVHLAAYRGKAIHGEAYMNGWKQSAWQDQEEPAEEVMKALRDVTIDQFSASESEMPPDVAKRCRFIIEENQRVLELGPALGAGDRTALSDLFETSYIGARDLLEIGAPAMEAMMHAMQSSPGLVAARQAGAGFGGCMVALVEQDTVPSFCDYVEQRYFERTGIKQRTFPVTASQGAGMLFS